MAIFPFIFIRGNYISDKTLNHEKIHFEQQKELWIIGFYMLYIFFHLKFGYNHNPFEIEAYENESNLKYIETRGKFAWL